ncbi:pyridoxal-phosphate dependent enzyme [Stenotrophomonas sp. 24(2023)]|uniref:pyridoxal-phosphate dependent enzyme n=1 Tax=Stenotrophomonas sp. 24(2023) TaxID=3068324 RepID=UPI0027E0AA31|nr:pyridoxal-phosphate dependent enzyme [Stenotrophomonas sp. 24(2023)]WMJ69284.1 pyridoxal-phosphate dependent enzyme [Stenotrophomonas sp. 24(2023)]
MTRRPRIALGSWPTPLEPAPRLSQALGLRADDLWIKRDDLTGLAGGGNKIRKLEYTGGQALAEGATLLVTVGAAQSNHARLTAAAAARLGVDVLLVLAGHAPQAYTGNIALDGLLGARIHWAGDVDDHALEALAQAEVDRLQHDGVRAVLIPFGGSNAAAVQGYVDGGEELLHQAPDLAHVFTAIGSGGTMAGLVQALGAERVHGVDAGAVADPEGRVRGLLSAYREAAFEAPLRIRHDQVGAGYGHLTPAVAQALQLAARTAGIILDPIYTGRAFAGLIAAVREGQVRPGERTVFLHSGGLPGLFGNPEALALSAHG